MDGLRIILEVDGAQGCYGAEGESRETGRWMAG